MTDNPLDRLALERKRMMFAFYGARNADRSTGGVYFKQAHSLKEAMDDMEANDGIAGGPYLVVDAFIEEDGEGGTLHVEVVEL